MRSPKVVGDQAAVRWQDAQQTWAWRLGGRAKTAQPQGTRRECRKALGRKPAHRPKDGRQFPRKRRAVPGFLTPDGKRLGLPIPGATAWAAQAYIHK